MSIFGSLFNKPKPIDFSGFTDWHSHILPGVDDGVQTLDEALAILSDYERMGFGKVWLTPHIMEDIPNKVEELKKSFAALKDSYTGSIELHLAAENMIDAVLNKRLADNDLLAIGRAGNTLLVETSYFHGPMNFDRTIENIKSKGYFPLIAHPERYSYVSSMSEYGRWKDMGCRFQLNLLSLGGFYGETARHFSTELLKKGMYDCIGTDIHRPSQVGHIKELRLPAGIHNNLTRLIQTSNR